MNYYKEICHEELEERMDKAADFLVGVVDHFSGRRVVDEDELERFIEEMCCFMNVEFFPFYSHIKEMKEFKKAV